MGQRPDRDPVRSGGGVVADASRASPRPRPRSGSARPPRRAPARWHGPPEPGSMLSSSRASAPACAASATWSSVSHSICTTRPGHSARARATASVMVTPARWLSLTSTASDRLDRWLTPPPACDRRLLEGAESRRGLARIEHLHRRIAGMRRGDVARRQGGDPREPAQEVERRALRREDRPQRPGDLHHRRAGRQHAAVGGVPDQGEVGARAGGRSRWRRPGRPGPRLAGPQGELCGGALGDERRGQVTVGQQILGQGPGDGLGDDGGGWIDGWSGAHRGAT